MAKQIYLWRVFLVVIALCLIWVSLVNGVGSYYVDRVKKSDKQAIDAALAWLPNHPEILLEKGLQIMPREQKNSITLLERAYRANPSDPRPLTTLAALSLLEDSQLTQGDQLVELAARLAPADPRNHRAIAVYWIARGRYDLAVDHWSSLLEADRSKRDKVYPALLAIASDPASRSLLGPVAAASPSWWQDFFIYAAQRAAALDAVRFLYLLRRQVARQSITQEERSAFVERLQKEGAISEAYVVWISGLDANARRYLGLLFDGGFDLPLEGRGFGWRISPHKNLSVSPEPTRGASGRAALRLRLRSFEGNFAHLAQPLVLDPGTYRLLGRARVDSLDSPGGLRWVVRCLQPTPQILVEGPRFVGSTDWTAFNFSFEVPEGCVYQQLVLTAAGNRRFEQKFNGDLWFDDLKIVRAASLDAAARADAILRQQGQGVTEQP